MSSNDLDNLLGRILYEGSDTSKIIGINLKIFKFLLGGDKEIDGLDEKSLRVAVVVGGAGRTERGWVKPLTIYYNTRTGEIQHPNGSGEIGDFSRINTFVLPDGSIEIISTNPTINSSIEEVNMALNLRRDKNLIPDHESIKPGSNNTFTCQPQRIDPSRALAMVHPTETWGTSEIQPDVSGDAILLESIMQYNESLTH